MKKDLTVSNQLKAAKTQLGQIRRSTFSQLGPAVKNQLIKSFRGQVDVLNDLSGSMAGAKEDTLKGALREVYPQLPKCTLVVFADDTVREVTLGEIDFIQSYGGTPMLKALMHSWNRQPDAILLITDGHPDGGTDAILGHASQHTHIPISAIGIGDGTRAFNEKFLKELCAMTGGEYKNVHEDELHLLSSTMESLLMIEHQTDTIEL